MITLQGIVEEYTGAYPDFLGRTGFRTWQEIRDEMKKDIELYATECCKATLEKAKDKASMSLFDYVGTSFKKHDEGNRYSINDGTYIEIDKESITSPENIVLL